MDHSHIRAYFLAIVTTLLTILAVFMLRPFLVTIGLAAVFAVVFAPLHARLRRARIPEPVSALVTLLFGVVCVAVPLSFLSVQLFSEAQNVYTAVAEPGSVAQAQRAIVSLGDALDRSIPGAGAYVASASQNLGAYARSALRLEPRPRRCRLLRHP